jgi:hypothetical protein
MSSRRPVAALAVLAALILFAVPALAINPDAKPGKADKPATTPITVSGTILQGEDADGHPEFSLTSGGTTYTLESGPAWFFGDKLPLKPFVGKSVSVTGQIAAGSTVIDVETVDGTALRAAGKPPWAGGWKRVGKLHPGWSQEKADRFKAKFGDCFPPGQCKSKPDHAGSDEPEATAAP